MSTSLAIALMLTAYLLVMGCLAAGLRILRTRPRCVREQAVDRARVRGDWWGFVRIVAGTALGGYLLLMIVVVGYYRGVARVGSHFLASAFTGCAALLAIALPVFFLASWLTVRRRNNGRSGTPR